MFAAIRKPKRNKNRTLSSPRFIKSQETAHFRTANSLTEVLAAWRLVYRVYKSTGLIEPNPFELHVPTEAIGPYTAVFHSMNGNEVESTFTAIEDGPDGLPLDSVYKEELDELRSQGRRPIECGLFAHRSQIADDESLGGVPLYQLNPVATEHNIRRVKDSLYQFMRLGLYFGLNRCSTDWVFGVHPRHARFYTRAFGLIPIGPEKQYPTVNHKPVVMLHGDLDYSLRQPHKPDALRYCWDNPIPPTAIESRYDFNTNDLINSHSPLYAYLQYKQATWVPNLIIDTILQAS